MNLLNYLLEFVAARGTFIKMWVGFIMAMTVIVIYFGFYSYYYGL
jgi:hypothetical protein